MHVLQLSFSFSLVLGLEIGLGVNRVRDRVRAGGEWVILFEKHPPHPKKVEKSPTLVRKKN